MVIEMLEAVVEFWFLAYFSGSRKENCVDLNFFMMET